LGFWLLPVFNRNVPMFISKINKNFGLKSSFVRFILHRSRYTECLSKHTPLAKAHADQILSHHAVKYSNRTVMHTLWA